MHGRWRCDQFSGIKVHEAAGAGDASGEIPVGTTDLVLDLESAAIGGQAGERETDIDLLHPFDFALVLEFVFHDDNAKAKADELLKGKALLGKCQDAGVNDLVQIGRVGHVRVPVHIGPACEEPSCDGQCIQRGLQFSGLITADGAPGCGGPRSAQRLSLGFGEDARRNDGRHAVIGKEWGRLRLAEQHAFEHEGHDGQHGLQIELAGRAGWRRALGKLAHDPAADRPQLSVQRLRIATRGVHTAQKAGPGRAGPQIGDGRVAARGGEAIEPAWRQAGAFQLFFALKDLHIRRIGRNHLGAGLGVEQVGSLQVPKVALAVVTVADQASGRAVRKGLEPGPKLSALALNFHGEIDLRGVRSARMGCRAFERMVR